MVLRVLQTGGGEACTNQCGWVRKAKQSSGSAERSGLAGRSGGLAGRGRQRSFVERQRFWVFPLQFHATSSDNMGGKGIDDMVCGFHTTSSDNMGGKELENRRRGMWVARHIVR